MEIITFNPDSVDDDKLLKAFRDEEVAAAGRGILKPEQRALRQAVVGAECAGRAVDLACRQVQPNGDVYWTLAGKIPTMEAPAAKGKPRTEHVVPSRVAQKEQ